MIVLAIVLVLIVALYFYTTRNFDYWSKRGVPHDKPIPFFGNDALRLLMRRSVTQRAAETYFKYPGQPFVGYFRCNTPELVIRDPDLIKQIITLDFAYFYPRGLISQHKNVEPLLRNLFFADGDLWRLLRQRMTPAFSSGRLRAMFPLVAARAERLRTSLAERVNGQKAAQPIDARELMARYTTDFIGAVGFGLDPASLNEEDSEFRRLGVRIFEIDLHRAIRTTFKTLFPNVFRKTKFFGQKLEDDVLSLVNSILKQRGYKNSGRNDFIDILMEIKNKGKISVESLEHTEANGSPKHVMMEMDDKLLAAQAFIFFAAGFETSSSATSFTLHQLAFHPEVQRKVQENIDKVLASHDNQLSYDAVKDMTYLEWAFLEGMRMFPSSGFLIRECARAYTLPGGVRIDPGVRVNVPLQALHNDPQYFPNPTEFRPERFSPEETSKRHKFVYMPFGEGPRSCIGGRLGQMQSMAGLAAVLSRFSVAPAPNTLRHLQSDPLSLLVQNIVGGVPLLFVPRDSGVPDSVTFKLL